MLRGRFPCFCRAKKAPSDCSEGKAGCGIGATCAGMEVCSPIGFAVPTEYHSPAKKAVEEKPAIEKILTDAEKHPSQAYRQTRLTHKRRPGFAGKRGKQGNNLLLYDYSLYGGTSDVSVFPLAAERHKKHYVMNSFFRARLRQSRAAMMQRTEASGGKSHQRVLLESSSSSTSIAR